MSADYRSIRWLDRRIWIARAKRAVRSALFWMFVAYLAGFASLVVLIGKSLRPIGAQTPAAVLPFAIWITFAAVLFVTYLALVAGVASTGTSPEYSAIALPQPFSLRTHLRWRLVKTLAGACAGWSLSLAVLGYALAGAAGLPRPDVIERLILVLFPYPIFWVAFGTVYAAQVSPRYPAATDYVVGGVSVLVLGTFAIGFYFGGSGLGKLFSNPLIAALYSFSTPPTEFALNMSLGLFGAAVFATEWVSAAAILPLALLSDLPLPQAYRGATTPPANQLSIERPSGRSWLLALRRKLRRPYRDQGVGSHAVEGLALTAAWRTGIGPMGVGMSATLLLFFAAGSATGPQSSVAGPIFFLGFAVFLGLFFLPAVRGDWWGGAVSVSRQSPFPEIAIARALLRPGLEYTVVIAGCLGLAAGIASRDPILGLVEAALFVSLFYLESVLGLFSSRSFGYPTEGSRRVIHLSAAIPFFGFMMLILAETALVLVFPQIPGLPGLLVPFAIFTTVNWVVASLALPSAARVLASPGV